MGRGVGLRRIATACLVTSLCCQVSVDFGDSEFRCDSEPFVCQPGFICDEGRCVLPDGRDDAGTSDAAPDGNGGLVVPRFLAPTRIDELSDPGARDDDPSLTADRLYVVFNSDRTGIQNLLTSERSTTDDSWSAPIVDPVLSSADDETTVALSADGLSVMYGSRRPGGSGNLDIYLSTRPSRQADWSTPENVTSLNSTASDAPGWISDDLTEVLIHSRRGGTNAIYAATLASGATYNTPELIAEVTSADSEFSGRFSREGLVLTFHSTRATGVGGGDLYVATRDSVSDSFGPERLIEGVNSPELDEDAWLSEDLCYIAFASESDGVQNIFEATCE